MQEHHTLPQPDFLHNMVKLHSSAWIPKTTKSRLYGYQRYKNMRIEANFIPGEALSNDCRTWKFHTISGQLEQADNRHFATSKVKAAFTMAKNEHFPNGSQFYLVELEFIYYTYLEQNSFDFVDDINDSYY